MNDTTRYEQLKQASKSQTSWISYVQAHPDVPLIDMYVGEEHGTPATLFGTVPLPYSTLTAGVSK